MCDRCADLPVTTQEVLAALFVAGASYAHLVDEGETAQATTDLDYALDQLLDGAPHAFIRMLMGCLVLMSLDELQPIYHQVMVKHHAKLN